MGEFGMHKRVEVFVAAAVAAVAGVAQPAAAQPVPPAAAAEAPVPVPPEVLERYVGRYDLNGAVATVGVTDGASFVGVLTPNGVHRALRESVAAETAIGTG